MTRSLPSALAPTLALVALTALGCRVMPTEPEAMYHTILRDFEGVGGFSPAVFARQDERYTRIEEWLSEGRLETAEDYLWCAAGLVTSDHVEHLVLSQTLALRAAEMGDERAFTIQAEAADKLLVKQGVPQRYGTQFVYEAVLQKWRLYPIDPVTTDEVRRAMGIPPMVELLAQVDVLNGADVSKRLRDEWVHEIPKGGDEPSYPIRMTTEDD